MVALNERILPPSPALLALEGRAWLEFAALVPALPLLARAPRGDGHPVLVLPGWLASDRSTWALRRFLRDRGYHVHGWRLGRNLGPDAGTVAGLGRRFVALRAELARRFHGDVRQVITLASPFRAPSVSSVARFYPRRRGQAPPATRTPLDAPLPVPSSSLYSRSDGVVAWRSCLQDEGPLAENIEVRSSHCGMGHHPGALLVIADRLAQPEGAWRPYTPPALPWRAALGLAG